VDALLHDGPDVQELGTQLLLVPLGTLVASMTVADPHLLAPADLQQLADGDERVAQRRLVLETIRSTPTACSSTTNPPPTE
jgi:hypothetical protein